MMDVTLRLLEPGAPLERAMVVRLAVFVDEQGIDPAIELDEQDPLAWHALAEVSGAVVGTGRVYLAAPGQARIGRMAVLPAWRLRGIGSAVLDLLELQARLLGADRVLLHAQETALEFYATSGYRVEGEAFEEAGIPHRTMVKDLE